MLQAPVKLHYSGKWDELCSQAELYLYNLSTPFFKGAQIGNVFNRIERGDPQTFSEMYNEAQGNGSSSSKANGSTARTSSSRPPSPSTPSYQAEERATIGTQLVNGKVASIRWISVDQPQGSLAAPSNTSNGGGWLSWLPGFKVKHRLNVLEVGSPTPDAEEEKVVMLHGYGAGTAFFFQNVEALGSRPNSRLYAIDWLGMGSVLLCGGVRGDEPN
jgi:cardiolipin-specific phospholipase